MHRSFLSEGVIRESLESIEGSVNYFIGNNLIVPISKGYIVRIPSVYVVEMANSVQDEKPYTVEDLKTIVDDLFSPDKVFNTLSYLGILEQLISGYSAEYKEIKATTQIKEPEVVVTLKFV